MRCTRRALFAMNKIEVKVRSALKQQRNSETKIEQRCIAHAKALGWTSRKMNGLGFRAWPDRLFVPRRHSKRYRLRAFWVEFKRPGKGPTPAQAQMHLDLRERGETVYVCDDLDGFGDIIARHN